MKINFKTTIFKKCSLLLAIFFVLSIQNTSLVESKLVDLLFITKNLEIREESGAAIISFVQEGEDAPSNIIYSLVEGDGDTDNASFTIEGTELKTDFAFDYETKNTYSIRVKMEYEDSKATVEKIIINVIDLNEPPIDIKITKDSIDENNEIGTVIGILNAIDVDKDDSASFKMVSGTEDTDNSKFLIDGNKLKAIESFDYEKKDRYNIGIIAEDSGNKTYVKSFSIKVNDIYTESEMSKNISSELEKLKNIDSDSNNEKVFNLTKEIVGNAKGYESKIKNEVEILEVSGLLTEVVKISKTTANKNPNDINLKEDSINQIIEAISIIKDVINKAKTENGTKYVLENIREIVKNTSEIEQIKLLKDDKIVKAEILDLMKKSSDLVENFESEEGIVNSIDNVSEIIKNGSMLYTNKGEIEKANTVNDTLVNLVKASQNKLENLKNEESLFKVTDSILNVSSDVLSKQNSSSVKKLNLKDEVAYLAQDVVNKISKADFEENDLGIKVDGYEGILSTVSDGQSMQVVGMDNEKVLYHATKFVSTAKEMDLKLVKNNIEKEIEKKIVLDVKIQEKAKQSKTQIPKELFEDLTEKGINKIELVTGVATVTMPKDFIEMEESFKSFNIESEKIEKNQIEEIKINGKDIESKNVLKLEAFIKSDNGQKKKVENFKKYLEIKVPYILEEDEDESELTIMYIKEDGTYENMGGYYDEKNKQFVFKTNHFSFYIINNNNVRFNDVGMKHWANGLVEDLGSKGVVVGVKKQQYNPSTNIKRSEFVTMFVKAFKINSFNKADVIFKDVHKESWYYKNVLLAYNEGLIRGRNNEVFDPSGTITRQEMATVVANYMKNTGDFKSNMTNNIFEKIADKENIANYAKNSITFVYDFEIMTGKPGNKFDPRGNATRAEAATVVYKLMKLMKLI